MRWAALSEQVCSSLALPYQIVCGYNLWWTLSGNPSYWERYRVKMWEYGVENYSTWPISSKQLGAQLMLWKPFHAFPTWQAAIDAQTDSNEEWWNFILATLLAWMRCVGIVGATCNSLTFSFCRELLLCAFLYLFICFGEIQICINLYFLRVPNIFKLEQMNSTETTSRNCVFAYKITCTVIYFAPCNDIIFSAVERFVWCILYVKV